MLHCGCGCFNWSHLFEGQLASQFETHHHHTSNPEKQDIMACLKQGARVEDIQVLGLKKNTNIYHKITLNVLCSHMDVRPLNCTWGFSSLHHLQFQGSDSTAEDIHTIYYKKSVFYLIRPSEDREGENAR